jgi:hypothetical protein
MLKQIVALSIGLALSGVAVSQEYPNEPTYDCTAEETKVYIEQVTANVFAPSPISTPDEFNKAHQETNAARAAAGDEDAGACAAILSGEGLKEGWQDIVKGVRDFSLPEIPSLSGIDMSALYDRLKEKAASEFGNALDQLGGDICQLVSAESIKGMLLDAANKNLGVNARSLRVEDFANELTEDALLGADQNILLLLSENELKKEISSESLQEMRKISKELWRNF